MNLITMEELKKVSIQQSFKDSYNKLALHLENLEDSGLFTELFAGETDIYPKYLWQEDKMIEIYSFTNSDITVISFGPDNNINFSKRFIKDISKLVISNLELRTNDINLDIHFSDGEILSFNSNDSNQPWKYKFHNKIVQLYKKLSTL